MILALAVGCSEKSAPTSNMTLIDTVPKPLKDTILSQMVMQVPRVDSPVHDSTPAERQAAARQRRRESDAKRKYYLPYEPGKGDAWELRRQDSILKAQQK